MRRDPLHRARRVSVAVLAAGATVLVVAPGAQAVYRAGPNYRLNSDPSPFRGKDQLALAVDPGNPQHIVETNANYLTESCEGTASFDGGRTWSQAAPLQPPALFRPSCRVSDHLGETMFQSVAFGSGKNVYATSITPTTVGSMEQGASALIYKSVDGGVTWGTGVPAMVGGSGALPTTPASGPYYELPTLAVDAGAGAGGSDRVYSVAHETTGSGNSGPPCPAKSCPSIQAAVSNDGGQTFGPAVTVSPPGVAIAGPDSASTPVVSPDHSVNIAWRTKGTTGQIQVGRSTDAGQTWSASVDAADVTGGGRPTTSHVTPLPGTGSSYPRLAGDSRNGTLYLVYNQGPPGPTAPAGGFKGADHFIDPAAHVYLQRSRDHGATWSAPKLIDDITPHPGSLTIQTRHPNVAVAPDGRVDIVWEDRRHWYQGPGEHDCVHTHLTCDDVRLGDTYYAYSTDGGTTFSPNRRISDRSHNNDVGYDYRFGTGWAFGPQSVAVGPGQVLIGWMDSREGSFNDDTQDIYLSRVNLNATGPAPKSIFDKPGPISLSVALSKETYLDGGEGVLTGTFATRNATRVVIVNQDDKAGALAGAVLARANVGPVLLSPPAGLPSSVKAEVSRLSPAGAYVVGDAAHLSGKVVSDLAASGVDAGQIDRLAGPDDAATAALIAARFDRRTDAERAAANPAFDAAVIVDPSSPDAFAASALAAARRLPILFVGRDSVPSATTAALSSLNVDKTLVIGGPQVVSAAVMGQLPSPTRLGGADQYKTSDAVVAESVARGLPTNQAYVADGARPMDAALLGAAVGRLTGILVLAPSPVSATAAGRAAAAGLRGLDRLTVAVPPIVLSHVSVTNTRFRVGKRRGRTPAGTRFRFTLSQSAKVSIVIARGSVGRRSGKRCLSATKARRHLKPCLRYTTKTTLVRSAHAGAGSVAFSGRVGTRALALGTYRATLTVTDAVGRRTKPVRVAFRVVR